MQVAQRYIIGGTAPGFQRQQLRDAARDMPGDRQQVPAAYPGGQQRLVRVAERGVGNRQRRLAAQVTSELRRAKGAEPLPRSAGRRGAEVGPGKLLHGVD